MKAAPASWKNIVPNRLITRSKPAWREGVELGVTALERDVPDPLRRGEGAGALDRRRGDVHAQRSSVGGGERCRAGRRAGAAPDVEDAVADLDVTGGPEVRVEPLELAVVPGRVRVTRVRRALAPAHQAS